MYFVPNLVEGYFQIEQNQVSGLFLVETVDDIFNSSCDLVDGVMRLSESELEIENQEIIIDDSFFL